MAPVASLEAGNALVIAILIGAFLVLTVLPVTVSFLKGRPWLGALGLVIAMPFAWWGTIRPARPDSWWAKHRYSPEQIAASEALYAPAPTPAPADPAAPAGWYPDPWEDAQRRYWDGAQWTSQVEATHPPPDETPPG